MSQIIGNGYLTPLEYAEVQRVKARVKFYDTELGGTPNDGRFLFELTGVITGGNFTFKDDSDMLASGNLNIVVDDVWHPNLSPSYLTQWYRCKCVVTKIYEYENGEQIEVPYGVYLVGGNSWNYNISSHVLSMTLKDCMEGLTEAYGNTLIGRTGGHQAPDWAFVQYETVLIKAGNDIGSIVQQFNENYSPFAYDTSIDGIVGDNTFPYDLQIESSSGLYEAFFKMKEIVPAGRMYFDVNGMFHFGQIPMRWAEPCHALGKHLTRLVISEESSVNPDSYRSTVVVWGADVEYKESEIISGRTVTSPTNTSEVGKYFGVASDYSDGFFEDTKCDILEFSGLSSNTKCRSMAKYELYKRRRMTETLVVTIADRPLPMLYQFQSHVLNVGQKIEYTSVVTGETDLYILTELSNDLSSCTMTLTLSKFYEFYPEDDYEDKLEKFPDDMRYEYKVENNILHIDFFNADDSAIFKIFVDNVFHSETCTDVIDVILEEGRHYIQVFAYNPNIKQKELGWFSVSIGDSSDKWLITENGEPMVTEMFENIIVEESEVG